MIETGKAAPDRSEGEDETAYATALEEVFIAERGTPFLLSPKDWQLIRSWKERAIPVDTAIRAVKETFARRRSRGTVGKISSIAYCENAVEERWELERRGLVGKGEGLRDVPPESVGPRLLRLVASLEAAGKERPSGVDRDRFRRALEKTLDKIRALPEGAFDEMEEALSEIEKAFARSLWKTVDEETASRLRSNVEEALGEPGGVSSDVREKTRRALERREIRRFLSLPPLTLFDV